MAAAILVALGHRAETVFDTIAAARRVPVPDTDEQRDWVLSIGM